MTAAARAAPGDPGGLPRAEKPAGAEEQCCRNQNTSAAHDWIYSGSRLNRWTWYVNGTTVRFMVLEASLSAWTYGLEMQ